MEPARYTLAVLIPQPDHRWHLLEAALNASGSPHVTIGWQDATVTFTADTWDMLLRSRVADALEEVWGHGEAARTFGPVGVRPG